MSAVFHLPLPNEALHVRHFFVSLGEVGVDGQLWVCQEGMLAGAGVLVNQGHREGGSGGIVISGLESIEGPELLL